MAYALSYYLENNLIDTMLRGQTFSFPATTYVGLSIATKGYWTASTAYSIGDTVLPTSPNGHIYYCTTAGTSGATQPTWTTTISGTVTDNTVTWTEGTPYAQNNALTEVSGGSYARVSYASSLTDWAGTQGAGTTTPSTGISGETSNNVAITFPAATANWGLVFGFYLYDASTAGNAIIWAPLTTPQQINSGSTPSFAAAALTLTFD